MAFKNCESTYGNIKQTKHKKYVKTKKELKYSSLITTDVF